MRRVLIAVDYDETDTRWALRVEPLQLDLPHSTAIAVLNRAIRVEIIPVGLTPEYHFNEGIAPT